MLLSLGKGKKARNLARKERRKRRKVSLKTFFVSFSATLG